MEIEMADHGTGDEIPHAALLVTSELYCLPLQGRVMTTAWFRSELARRTFLATGGTFEFVPGRTMRKNAWRAKLPLAPGPGNAPLL